MFLLHMPAAIRPFIKPDFNLDCAQTITKFVCDYQICVWDTSRGQCRNHITTQKLAHNIVLTSRP